VSVDLVVDVGLYPVEAVMGAAYVFVDRCYVLLDRLADGKVKVALSARPGTSEEAFRDLAGQFQNELLAQALRHRIGQRHEKLRETIVARALFGAAPEMERGAPGGDLPALDPKHLPGEEDDYLDDPLGIAVPWEEKYGKAQAGGAGGTAVEAVAAGQPEKTPGSR
jgi:His-Xaa-Ser system protein HxsD